MINTLEQLKPYLDQSQLEYETECLECDVSDVVYDLTQAVSPESIPSIKSDMEYALYRFITKTAPTIPQEEVCLTVSVDMLPEGGFLLTLPQWVSELSDFLGYLGNEI